MYTLDPTKTLTDNQLYDSFYLAIGPHDVTWKRTKQAPRGRRGPLRLTKEERERRVQLRIEQYEIMAPFRVSPFHKG